LKLPTDWDIAVRKMLQENVDTPDPEMERREIREQIRRMRTAYNHGIYKDDEYLFWSEIEALQERLKRLEMPQETMINRAAQTLLNLKESWQEATLEEQRELVQIMLQEVACSIHEQQVTWVKPQPGFETLFMLVNDLRSDKKGRFFLK